jgi:hypothetical protein
MLVVETSTSQLANSVPGFMKVMILLEEYETRPEVEPNNRSEGHQ